VRCWHASTAAVRGNREGELLPRARQIAVSGLQIRRWHARTLRMTGGFTGIR